MPRREAKAGRRLAGARLACRHCPPRAARAARACPGVVPIARHTPPYAASQPKAVSGSPAHGGRGCRQGTPSRGRALLGAPPASTAAAGGGGRRQSHVADRAHRVSGAGPAWPRAGPQWPRATRRDLAGPAPRSARRSCSLPSAVTCAAR